MSLLGVPSLYLFINEMRIYFYVAVKNTGITSYPVDQESESEESSSADESGCNDHKRVVGWFWDF